MTDSKEKSSESSGNLFEHDSEISDSDDEINAYESNRTKNETKQQKSNRRYPILKEQEHEF